MQLNVLNVKVKLFPTIQITEIPLWALNLRIVCIYQAPVLYWLEITYCRQRGELMKPWTLGKQVVSGLLQNSLEKQLMSSWRSREKKRGKSSCNETVDWNASSYIYLKRCRQTLNERSTSTLVSTPLDLTIKPSNLQTSHCLSQLTGSKSVLRSIKVMVKPHSRWLLATWLFSTFWEAYPPIGIPFRASRRRAWVHFPRR